MLIPLNKTLQLLFSGLAPDVFRGNCIKPCTKCTQKQIRKVIVLLQQNFPREFSAVLHKFRQGRSGWFFYLFLFFHNGANVFLKLHYIKFIITPHTISSPVFASFLLLSRLGRIVRVELFVWILHPRSCVRDLVPSTYGPGSCIQVLEPVL